MVGPFIIVHSVRTPERLRHTDKRMHGLHIWVALPQALEDIAPYFHHIEAKDLPTSEQDGARFRLIAGEVMGHRSAVPVHSPLYLLEVSTIAGATLRIGEHPSGASGLYILEGAVIDDGVAHGPRQLLVAKDSGQCSFQLAPGSTVYLFGGKPFPEERFIYWHFVATSQQRLQAAKQRWRDGAFPAIDGEHDPVPLPGTTW